MTRGKRTSGKLTRLGAAMCAATLGLTLAACGGDPLSSGGNDAETIVVGSADFAENEIIAEIYAQALEANDISVERKLRIGAREAYIVALENKEIDLIPEYTGNLLTYFDKEATATSAEEVQAALDEVLPEEFELYDAAAAENKDSLNVTPEFAADNDLLTIADLAKVDELALAANPEFKERPGGIPGLERVYGIVGITFVPISDGGGPATLKALLDGDVQVADIYSTTPSILANKLVTLEDPKNMFTAQHVVPLIRDAKGSDKVQEVLDKVSGALTTTDLLDLNTKNQGDDKTSAKVLAKEWLEAKALF